MNRTIFIKSLISYPLSYLQQATEYLWHKPSVLILMYHRITDVNIKQGLIQEGMYVDPKTFDKQLKYLNKHYDVVTLEICYEMLTKNDIKNKKLCCITFDDGWKDFYDNAYPILNANNTCATVFLPTEYMDTTELFWTDKLGMILVELDRRGTKSIDKDPGEPMIEILGKLSGPIMTKFETAIREMKGFQAKRIDDINKNYFERLGLPEDITERSFLSWNEVLSMKDSGIVQFGSHTRNHVILTTIDEDAVSDELVKSKEKLLEKGAVSESFIPFSYPNGNYTDRIVNLVRNAGYQMAVTTKKGLNYPDEKPINLYELERIGIHQDITRTSSMFACRINGLF